MSKIVLDNVEGGFNLQKINSNFQKIEDELNDKVLYRSNPIGEPNSMSKALDMDGNDLLNVKTLSVTSSLSIGGIDLGTEVAKAQTFAGEALASALSANASATAASSSASSAASSVSTAAASASTATTQAGIATTKAAEAVVSASNAATSASTATTQATNSSNSATSSSTNAGTATTQASAASASASSADAAKTAAEAARDSALASYDSFDDRYLGPKSSAPTLDNDGQALLTGSLYWDTTLSSMRAYTGTAWTTLPSATAGAVSNTPAGNIAATNVQTALNELDVEKAKVGANSDITSLTGLTTAISGTSLGNKIQPISATVASNALTLTLNPTTIDFRDSTTGSGAVNTRVVSTAITLVVPAGATLGSTNGVASKLILYAIDNAGTIELAVTNANGGNNLDETILIGTAAISTGSTLATMGYSTTARSNTPYRVVGYVESTQATAGTWATAPSTVQGTGGLSSIPILIKSTVNASGNAPIYAARAWVNFNGTGAVANRGSGNVSSVTDHGPGEYSVNFATAMPDANYSFAFGLGHSSSLGYIGNNTSVAPTVSSLRFFTSQATGLVDLTQVSVSIFR